MFGAVAVVSQADDAAGADHLHVLDSPAVCQVLNPAMNVGYGHADFLV